ncbi:MAG: NUDIX hydrolase [Acidimicrobiales bacterium]
MSAVAPDGPERRIRLAVYAWIVHDGAVLLARNSPRVPNRGHWALPGGGVDWGEHPEVALDRELYEETGLAGSVEEFLGIDSVVYDAGPLDVGSPLHAVRLVYRMTATGTPTVIERDGTTDEAAWIPLGELERLPTVSLVDWALARHRVDPR